jgi:hypothetical protein
MLPAGCGLSRKDEISIFAAKTGSRVLAREAQNGSFPGRKVERMRARPEVREILIAHKLRYWSLRAQYPSCFPNCRPSRARRNFLRLLAKYPQIGKRLGLTVLSAYPPL